MCPEGIWQPFEPTGGLDRLTGGMTFRTEQGGEKPSAAYPTGVTVAIFDRAGAEPLVSRYPALREAVERRNARCHRWELTDRNFVTVCDV
jgi:hypothetical protein